MKRIWLSVLILLALAPASLSSQESEGTNGQPTLADVPFGVGEKATYRVKFGPLEVGQASMEIAEIDSVAGHPTYHMVFAISGGTFFYKMDDKQESWLDVYALASRRYRQDLHQGDWERLRVWEFDLEGLTYQRSDGVTDSIPPNALDEAAFIYFTRTVPLEVGETYEWNRYFQLERNPVILQVLRREEVKVPAGQFSTVVVRPIIKTRGIFAEGGEAEIYITDDELRIPVKLTSRLKVGTLSLEMVEFEPGTILTYEVLGMSR